MKSTGLKDRVLPERQINFLCRHSVTCPGTNRQAVTAYYWQRQPDLKE
jgi:hypothetical protein